MTKNTLAKAPAESTEQGPSRPMRILVIDDNELDRQRLIRLCGQAGLRFEESEVAGLAELPEALEKQPYDIVFIDYYLAGDTGLEALEILSASEKQKHAAAIMLAGEGQINIAVEAMRQGCSDYMTKAMMNVDTLQKSIATALERRLMADELAQARGERVEVEEAIRSYARACTAEMREVLSGTLRRVRKLRSYKSMAHVDYVIDLNSLETEIDKLWDAMPDAKAAPRVAVATKPVMLPNSPQN